MQSYCTAEVFIESVMMMMMMMVMMMMMMNLVGCGLF